MCLIFIEPLFRHCKNDVFNHCSYAPEVSSEPPILCSTSCHAFLQRPSLALPTTTRKKRIENRQTQPPTNSIPFLFLYLSDSRFHYGRYTITAARLLWNRASQVHLLSIAFFTPKQNSYSQRDKPGFRCRH